MTLQSVTALATVKHTATEVPEQPLPLRWPPLPLPPILPPCRPPLPPCRPQGCTAHLVVGSLSVDDSILAAADDGARIDTAHHRHVHSTHAKHSTATLSAAKTAPATLLRH